MFQLDTIGGEEPIDRGRFFSRKSQFWRFGIDASPKVTETVGASIG